MLNQANIIGRLGRPPEIRYTAAGMAVANLSVATTEVHSDRQTGERRETTEWHRVSLFGRLAEVAGQYLDTGALVYVSGRLRTRKFAGNDGIDRYTTEIIGDVLKMLGGRGSQNDQAHATDAPDGGAPIPTPTGRRSRRAAPPAAASFDDTADDIPF